MANTAALLGREKLWTGASKLQVIVNNSLPAAFSNSLIQNVIANGCVAEISGRRSTGKTSLCLHILAQATARGEVCAVVDMHHSFDPASAEAAGIALEQIVWVRCRRDAQYTMRAADLLVHAGGFGVVLLDLCEASRQALQRIPISFWHRLRRAVEHTPTVLLVCANFSEVKCSFSKKLWMKRKAEHWVGEAPFLRFEGLQTIATATKASGLSMEHFDISSVA